jgi:hypothetical protein
MAVWLVTVDFKVEAKDVAEAIDKVEDSLSPLWHSYAIKDYTVKYTEKLRDDEKVHSS